MVAGTAPASRTAADAVLVSTLPTDDSDFREIVEEFVARLHEQIDLMQQALSTGDLAELARLAHWLKGAGGTAGFGVLTDAAERLEELVKRGHAGPIKAALDEIGDLAGRIAVPSE